MRRYCAHSFVFAAALLMTLAMVFPAHAQNRNPDSTLYTLYDSNQPPTYIQWLTCGSTPQTGGCYGSGSLGPFTNACAIVQSVPAALNLETVLRYIYVLDTGSTANGATLTVYRRTDTVTQTYDYTNVTTLAGVPLSTIVGGAGVTCSMVQNPSYVYATTNQSHNVAAINKTSFSANSIGPFEAEVTALTADSYGYVTIVWGTGFETQFQVLAPNGQAAGSGGGSYFMINPIDAVSPANYPPADGATLPKLGH